MSAKTIFTDAQVFSNLPTSTQLKRYWHHWCHQLINKQYGQISNWGQAFTDYNNVTMTNASKVKWQQIKHCNIRSIHKTWTAGSTLFTSHSHLLHTAHHWTGYIGKNEWIPRQRHQEFCRRVTVDSVLTWPTSAAAVDDRQQEWHWLDWFRHWPPDRIHTPSATDNQSTPHRFDLRQWKMTKWMTEKIHDSTDNSDHAWHYSRHKAV